MVTSGPLPRGTARAIPLGGCNCGKHWRKDLNVPSSRRRDHYFMKIALRNGIWALALTIGGASSGAAANAFGPPLFQDHEQEHQQEPEKDYSKNKSYQQGMREGRDDHAHNRDHSKKRHFKKDEDQKAYDAGYGKGHGN